MDIFLSYSSKYRDLAERLELALEAEGHRCFVDRTELEPGQAFDAALREAIGECDAFIFLVSPESVATGSYTLAELNLAQQRWNHPRGRVLPVVVTPTPMGSIPPYLKAVTLLEPKGEVVAETLAAVARMGSRGRRPLVMTVIGVAVIGALAVGGLFYVWQQRAAERAEREQRDREVASASELCNSGTHSAAWNRLDELAAHTPSDASIQSAREQCGMRWLREIRVRANEQTFESIVRKVQPVLVAGLPGASGQRAADLFAHLGWADYLLTREGAVAGNPEAQFQRAIKDEPENVYAHAMWGRHLWWSRDRDADARQHFARAVAAGRDREFVRTLQLGGALSRAELAPYAVLVANDMRLGNEPMNDGARRRLWSMAYWSELFSNDDRSRFLAILPPDAHLATYDWLYPRAAVREGEIPVWRYMRAVLQANAGQTAEARSELEALLGELTTAKVDGRIVDRTRRALAELAPPHASQSATAAKASSSRR